MNKLKIFEEEHRMQMVGREWETRLAHEEPIDVETNENGKSTKDPIERAMEARLTPDEMLLKNTILDVLKPYLYDADSEHGSEHVHDVMRLGININVDLDLGIDKKEIIVAALTHDMFSSTHRKEHHTKAQEWVSENLLKANPLFERMLDEEAVKRVAHAVGEHRGSYKGEFYSPLSELISSADRGHPGLEEIIERIYMCSIDPNVIMQVDLDNLDTLTPNGIKDYPTIVRELKEEGYSDEVIKTFLHLVDKYSITGYARHPKFYNTYYKDELASLWSMIDRMIKEPVDRNEILNELLGESEAYRE